MKDLLGIEELTRQDMERYLATAVDLKARLRQGAKKMAVLSGRVVVTLFLEASTRTRTSFELAGRFLGAHVQSFALAQSSVDKGETLVDTARALDAMAVDAIVVRHAVAGVPHDLARRLEAAVVNAGDGWHEHPTQALLDALTILERRGRVEGQRIAILGDIRHSRVARSAMLAYGGLGASVTVFGPATLVPEGVEAYGAEVATSLEAALAGADVVQVLRIQRERMHAGLIPSLEEYHRRFGLTQERLRLARPDAVVMHPGPVNRGVEIESRVADGPRSAVMQAVENGVAMRMAVLCHLLGEGGSR